MRPLVSKCLHFELDPRFLDAPTAGSSSTAPQDLRDFLSGYVPRGVEPAAFFAKAEGYMTKARRGDRRMKLLHLKGRNFRSFVDFDLDLNASGLFSVTGCNGAGKSSIFSAVEWALFGGKRGPNAPRVRRQGANGDECRVELEFEVAGRTLKVVRIDGKDAWLADVASGEKLATGLHDTSREAAVQLGLTQAMFCGTFYARQKRVQALSSGKSLAERRDNWRNCSGSSTCAWRLTSPPAASRRRSSTP